MATKRCNCLRRLSVARLALRTRVRGSAGREHGRPQLANAPAEQVLPGQDAFVRRQPAERVEPVLQLIQGGISRWPDRRGRATIAGILIDVLAAGILLGFGLTIVHLGINLERATAPGGSTVDADSGNH